MQRFSRALLPSLAVSVSMALLAGCGRPEPVATRGALGQPLPLRSLRLYETGVGYFERSGTVANRSATSLPVPASHLDDALKSLIVLNGGGGGTVTGVAFASRVTPATARARAALPTDSDHPIGFKDLLVSMKGEIVALSARGASVATGRVIEVTEELDEAAMRARAMAPSEKTPPDLKRLTVTLLTNQGEVMVFAAQDIVKIRPADQAFAGRLDAALDTLSTRSAQNVRSLTLLGDARGQVTFGYIAETPIWRSSYRLIVAPSAKTGAPTNAAGNSREGQGPIARPPPREQARLQGWALVHNDTDEPWRGVHLELVNGEPDSFLFPLAAPRYARRPLVAPESPLSTLPQLQDTTADTLWGDNIDAVALGTVGTQGYGSGHGSLSGSHATRTPAVRMGTTTTTDTGASSVLSVGNLAELAPAQGVESGAQFVYTVPGAFALDAHATALVPFLSKTVETEVIALFSAPDRAARAAVRFVNSTGQTLPAGTFAVFGAGGFAGETSLDRLKPGERRFLQVGNDLDAGVTSKIKDRKEESKRLTFHDDRLEEHFLATSDLGWELENRGATARSFYVGLAADRNSKVTGADRVDFDEAASKPVVVFDVAPQSKALRKFSVVEGLSRSTSVDKLTGKLVQDLLKRTTLPAPELALLAQAEPRIRALEAEHLKTAEAERVANVANEEVTRLRDDMKSLGGGEKGGGAGTAAAPLVKRVLEAEDRLEASRKNKEAAAKEIEKRREAVREILTKLGPR